jgi:outer membrane immunogenic protein
MSTRRHRLLKGPIQAAALICAFGAVTPVVAADLGPLAPPSAPYKAGPFAAPLYDWTGFYIGGHFGAGWSTTTATDRTGGSFAPAGAGVDITSNAGFLGGGQLGYNYQTGPWVFGVEGDFSYTDIHGATTTVAAPANVGLTSRLNWVGTVTGRLGYTWDRTLLYAKAGLAFGNVTLDITPPKVAVFDSKDTRTGWTVGAGAEYALWNNWSLKAEYNYLDLGTRTVTATSPTGASVLADSKVTEHMIKLGANYKFNLH